MSFRVRFERVKVCKCGHERFLHRFWKDKCAACECPSWRPVRARLIPNERVERAGTVFDSKAESKNAWDLEAMQKAGIYTNVKHHVPLDLIVNGQIIGHYKIDHLCVRPDGVTELIETKGFPTNEWKLKWKILEAMHHGDPKYELKILFVGGGNARWNRRRAA